MQERPKTLQDRLTSAQGSPQMPSRRSKIALRRQKSGQEGSWNDPGAILRRFGAILGCKMCVFPYVFQYFLRIRGFALKSFPKASWSPICTNLGRLKWSRAPQERPRDPQEEPKSAPERPKSDPRAAKSGPRAAQERPKSSQERPKSDQERPKSGQERPKGEPELRRWAQERPRRAQDGPGPSKGRPKTPQIPPRTPPNAPQEAPRSLQECEVRPKSFEIVMRCRKKSRQQKLEPCEEFFKYL